MSLFMHKQHDVCLYISLHLIKSVMNTKTTTGLIGIPAALTLAVGVSTMSVQQVFAPTCGSCSKTFAPGQIAIDSSGETSASNVAPGHEVPPGPGERSGDGVSDFAPGIEKQIQTGPGP
jgi:hypothetical protein